MSFIEIVLLAGLSLLLLGQFLLHRLHVKLVGSLRAQEARCESREAMRHTACLGQFAQLSAGLDAAELRQEQRNQEQLQAALAGVKTDFHQCLLVQFDAHLAALVNLSRSSGESLRKQREEQMESMHHARRIADKMDGATKVFGALVAENGELLSLAGQVRAALLLLGTRQDALDSDIRRQAESVEAMGTSVREMRSGFEQTAEHLLLQTRRGLDTIAQRQSQGNSALQKELNDALGKAVAVMAKQISSMAPGLQQSSRALRQ
jgi:hypothetical protein